MKRFKEHLKVSNDNREFWETTKKICYEQGCNWVITFMFEGNFIHMVGYPSKPSENDIAALLREVKMDESINITQEVLDDCNIRVTQISNSYEK